MHAVGNFEELRGSCWCPGASGSGVERAVRESGRAQKRGWTPRSYPSAALARNWAAGI